MASKAFQKWFEPFNDRVPSPTIEEAFEAGVASERARLDSPIDVRGAVDGFVREHLKLYGRRRQAMEDELERFIWYLAGPLIVGARKRGKKVE
jgi:hypothetical protein